MNLLVKITLIILCTWLVTNTSYAQSIRVIDNKGTINTADKTADAFKNNTITNAVELGTNADGSTIRVLGSEFVIKDDGSVGIGTNSPSTKLDVQGGDVRVGNYPFTRDDTSSTTINNILYTDANGNLLSAPVSSLIPAATSIKLAEFVPTTSFNCNTSSLTAGNFFGSELSNDGAVTRTSSSTITINETGLYDVTFNCVFSSFGNRAAPMATLYVNGSTTRIRAATGYIRNGSGHNRSSWNFQYKRRFNSGDTIRIFTQREAGGASTNIDVSFTSFIITRLGL